MVGYVDVVCYDGVVFFDFVFGDVEESVFGFGGSGKKFGLCGYGNF